MITRFEGPGSTAATLQRYSHAPIGMNDANLNPTAAAGHLMELLRSRRYRLSDHLAFAALSGDYNPVHLDRGTARRELFGAPIAHGVHAVIEALDAALATPAAPPGPVRLRSLAARFDAPIVVGSSVDFRLASADGSGARVAVRGGELLLADVQVGWEEADGAGPEPAANRVWPPAPPDVPVPAELASRRDELELALQPEAATRLFPAATARLPSRDLAAILALSRVVGMKTPGLRSIFSGFSVTFPSGGAARLEYRVLSANPRLGLVSIGLSGAVEGTIDAVLRPGLQLQPSMGEAAGRIAPDACAGQVALVIGGSRGIGEITAKLIAAGGGTVLLTYRRGAEDARRVAREIRAAGARCEVLRWDALAPSRGEAALAASGCIPTHCYYFATPKIFVTKAEVYNSALFASFARYYVDGFAAAIRACRRLQTGQLAALYPSSVAAGEVTRGLAEYAAAKAAGESLCRHLEQSDRKLRIVVERLPRIATDQTASMIGFPALAALDVMAPLVERLGTISAA